MMDVFDLRAKAGVRAPKLSGGMRRRHLIARDSADVLREAYDAASLADVYVKAMAGLATDMTGGLPSRPVGLDE